MALDNLVMTATVSWDIVTKLATANADLIESVKTLADQLGLKMMTIQYLIKVTVNTHGTIKIVTETKLRTGVNSLLKI